MEAATPPFLHRITTIHGRLPSHLKSFDKRFKQLQIDRVVFHNKDTDGRYFGIQRGRRRVLNVVLLLRLASLALLEARGGQVRRHQPLGRRGRSAWTHSCRSDDFMARRSGHGVTRMRRNVLGRARVRSRVRMSRRMERGRTGSNASIVHDGRRGVISSSASRVVLAVVALRIAIPMRARPGAARRRNGRKVARANDGHGMRDRCVGVLGGKTGRRRGADYWGKVSLARLGWTHVVGIVSSHSRSRTRNGRGGRPWRGPGSWNVAGNVDDEGLVNRLSMGEELLHNGAHVFLGAHHTRDAGAGIEAKSKIRRVIRLAQRVCVFSQNHVACIVNEIVETDSDERGRGSGPRDPNLARSFGHAAALEVVA